MTTTHEMELAYIQQQQVIAILRENSDTDVADRLLRCANARQLRYKVASGF